MPVRPMLLHRMALVSFRLFCKNLGNLQECFEQMVYRPPPPPAENCPYAYALAGAKQAGFRKDSGTRYNFFKLRMIIQKCREFSKDLYMCFIDCSKAFDYVSHSQLWGTLSKMGFPEREINLVRYSTRVRRHQYAPTAETQNGSK